MSYAFSFKCFDGDLQCKVVQWCLYLIIPVVYDSYIYCTLLLGKDSLLKMLEVVGLDW